MTRGNFLRILLVAILVLLLGGVYTLPLSLQPESEAVGFYSKVAIALLSLYIIIECMAGIRGTRGVAPPAELPKREVKAPAAVIAQGADYGEALAFLALLQEKGRFVDFLMEDITAYNDGQVAAASRVVHQGCAQVIREHLEIGPVFQGQEGDKTTVDPEADASRFRLVGKTTGPPPFKGTVVHRGWKTTRLSLPRYSKPIDRLAVNVITPAEIEVG